MLMCQQRSVGGAVDGVLMMLWTYFSFVFLQPFSGPSYEDDVAWRAFRHLCVCVF